MIRYCSLIALLCLVPPCACGASATEHYSDPNIAMPRRTKRKAP